MSAATDHAGGAVSDAVPRPRSTLPPATAVSGDGLPEHVRIAFRVRDTPAQPIVFGCFSAWRCGDVVIRPVADHAMAAWSADVLDTLRVERMRIARPVRASDGRWVVAGWSACQYLSGTPQRRYQELVAASLRLHAATASLRRPRLLDDRDDLAARADAAAWGERSVALAPEAGGRLFAKLAGHRRDVRLPAQVVHPDLFGTVLFDGAAPPAVFELVPFWRPAEWAAAVIVVDALAWGGADPELLTAWAHLPSWPQMLLRALLFRVALHAQHPAASTESLRGLEGVAELIVPLL